MYSFSLNAVTQFLSICKSTTDFAKTQKGPIESHLELEGINKKLTRSTESQKGSPKDDSKYELKVDMVDTKSIVITHR